MNIKRVALPTLTTITLQDAKNQTRLKHDLEDDLLLHFIHVAREHIEDLMYRSFINTEWDLTLDQFPCTLDSHTQTRVIMPPRSPLISVTHIKYIDIDGIEQTLPTDSYMVDNISDRGRIVEAFDNPWPEVKHTINAVKIRFKVGYGETNEDVPKVYKQILQLYVAHLFVNREAYQDNKLFEVPNSLSSLIEFNSARYWV